MEPALCISMDEKTENKLIPIRIRYGKYLAMKVGWYGTLRRLVRKRLANMIKVWKDARYIEVYNDTTEYDLVESRGKLIFKKVKKQ